ncbi:hypothetical protein NDU88_001380 [Pleurodeles waltl]|uniref:Uncharacterized protein n=1 Tax=Pleurodeles waltl TaxID=8319 RepID=A0AAV7R9L8_PLEWA|nr:hypothetical protein NDU88_001380 [Pleurodeles waltl]
MRNNPPVTERGTRAAWPLGTSQREGRRHNENDAAEVRSAECPGGSGAGPGPSGALHGGGWKRCHVKRTNYHLSSSSFGIHIVGLFNYVQINVRLDSDSWLPECVVLLQTEVLCSCWIVRIQ